MTEHAFVRKRGGIESRAGSFAGRGGRMRTAVLAPHGQLQSLTGAFGRRMGALFVLALTNFDCSLAFFI
jgi:hypothetical protein